MNVSTPAAVNTTQVPLGESGVAIVLVEHVDDITGLVDDIAVVVVVHFVRGDTAQGEVGAKSKIRKHLCRKMGYTGIMSKKVSTDKKGAYAMVKAASPARIRSIASSTAIETGESVKAVEEKILRLRAARKRAPLG